MFSTTDVTAEMNQTSVREDFIATISHEIRNPLTSIVGNLDLALENDNLPASVRKNITTSTDNSLRILDLVSELLEGMSERVSVSANDTKPTDVVAVIRAAFDSISPTALIRGITLQLVPEDPIILDLDRVKVLQVLENLLSNAIKYNVENGTISVSTGEVTTTSLGLPHEPASRFFELRISDTGLGVSPTEHKLLFQRFYRTVSAKESSVHGSGLGLHISRELMRSMGGDLLIESVEGNGTTAICRFPHATAAHPAQKSMNSPGMTGALRVS